MKRLFFAAGAGIALFFCDLCVFAQSEAAQPGKWDAIKGYFKVMGGITLIMLAIYFIAVLTGKIGQRGQAEEVEKVENKETEEVEK